MSRSTRHSSRSRKTLSRGRLHRPWLELLEDRLPPGDLSGGLLSLLSNDPVACAPDFANRADDTSAQHCVDPFSVEQPALVRTAPAGSEAKPTPGAAKDKNDSPSAPSVPSKAPIGEDNNGLADPFALDHLFPPGTVAQTRTNADQGLNPALLVPRGENISIAPAALGAPSGGGEGRAAAAAGPAKDFVPPPVFVDGSDTPIDPGDEAFDPAASFGKVAFSSSGPVLPSFTDETSKRLSLLDTPFVNETGAPISDNQEKDIAVADLNQDGRDDFIVARKRPFSNPGSRQAVLLMNQDGVLTDRTADYAPGFLDTLMDSRDVVAADFTGDGWIDVVFANTFGEQPVFYRNLGNDPKTGAWLGLANESADRFPTLLPAGGVGPKFCSVVAGDVDGDGDLDLYFSSYRGPSGPSPQRDILLINDGNGVFTDETAERLGTYANSGFGTIAAIRDINGDGYNDIIKVSTLFNVTPFNSIGAFVLFNNGSGVFNEQPFQAIPGSTSDLYMMVVADFNNDGRLDVYQVRDSQDAVSYNQGNDANGRPIWQTVTLAAGTSPRTTGFGGNAYAVDINGDGWLDVVVGPIDVDIANCPPNGTGRVAILLNNGSGTLADPWPLNPQQNFNLSAHDFAFSDINGDGKLDIFMGLCAGWRVLIQN